MEDTDDLPVSCMEDTDDLPTSCLVSTDGLPALCMEEMDDLTEDTDDAVEWLNIKRSKEDISFLSLPPYS